MSLNRRLDALEAKASWRFDALDAESFEDMVQSQPFSILTNRIGEVLERERLDLEQPQHDYETEFKRGYIAALRMVLGLRAQILSEMKAHKKGKT